MQETASSGEFRIDIAIRHLVTQTVGIKIVRHRSKAVLAYLSRYTHRVAISGRRLISLDETGVTFRYKDYRRDGAERYRTMTLASCCTCCREASAGAGITACSAVPTARPTSIATVRCSRYRRFLALLGRPARGECYAAGTRHSE
jgi:hypothetical protein